MAPLLDLKSAIFFIVVLSLSNLVFTLFTYLGDRKSKGFRQMMVLWLSLSLCFSAQLFVDTPGAILAVTWLLMLPTTICGGLFSTVANLPFSYLAYGLAGVALLLVSAVLYMFTDHFVIAALPQCVAAAMPLWIPTLTALLQPKRFPTSYNEKVLAVLLILGGLHHIDYAFLRNDPFLAPYGFLLAFFVYLSYGYIIPVVVTEKLRRQYQDKLEQDLSEVQMQSALQRNALANCIADTMQLIAHDLRQPFYQVSLVLKKLGGFYKSEEFDAMVQQIDQSTAYAQSLLGDLLEQNRYRQIRADRLAPRKLVEEVISHFKAIHDQRFCFEVDIVDFEVFADPTQVRRVFFNLVQNAIACMPDQASRIWLRSHRDTQDIAFLRFDVGNEGTYIDNTDPKVLFSRYQRPSPRAGTGLGLTICAQIIHNHGGSIACQSSRDMGTEFTFTLPLWQQGLLGMSRSARESRAPARKL